MEDKTTSIFWAHYVNSAHIFCPLGEENGISFQHAVEEIPKGENSTLPTETSLLQPKT